MSKYEIVEDKYGKSNVKVLHVKREGAKHSIEEYEVNTHLTLATKKDYLEGDNSDIVATDSQKNTVYLLAKKYGLKGPEEFAVLLCQHFLNTYSHVTRAQVYIEKHPWQRHLVNEKPHNHVFVSTPIATHVCLVAQERGGQPNVQSGLRDLRVLKTTQSAFVNFVNDEYRSLPDAKDRIFSTIVTARWDYACIRGVNFQQNWEKVRDIFMKEFSGPADTGVFSPSVQHTLYLAQKSVLDTITQVSKIHIELPNKHYFNIDLSKFPGVGSATNNDVFLPADKPSGNIQSALTRSPTLAKL